MTKLVFHSDPGHAWLEVSISDLRDVSLNPDDFTQWSYRQRNRFFLEEDCDAPKFIKAYEAKHGSKPEFIESHTDIESFIRNCQPIC